MATEDAHPFQAPELPFYHLHARLWLLIALARIAMDNPKRIAKYRNVLREIVLDEKSPHVLMRHFAAQAILACVDSGNLKLSAKREKQIRAINLSPFPRLRKKLKEGGYGSFYQGRPKDMPEPKTEFHLDYDFDKYDVHSLSNVFGKPGWEVKDLMSEVVHGFDPNVKSMYETGGREVSRRNSLGEMTSRYHSYGQQLGWHALFLVAGRLLSQHPVTGDSYADEPWAEWLNRSLLTRNDGLWLSDGMDRPPLGVKINLLEKGKDDLVITGNTHKIRNMVSIASALGKGIVVEGSWKSPDGIEVNISSALVDPRKAKTLVKQLIRVDPFFVWLPTYDQYKNEYEHLRIDKKEYVPWIICPSVEGRLDKDDSLGAICAENRPKFAESIIADFSLSTTDPFGRAWKTSAHKPVAHTDAWGHESEYSDERSDMGVRLVCSEQFLSDVLAKRNADLLVLVKLRRYEKGIGSSDSRFSHTVAVVRIKKTLDFEFYKGAVNKLHQTRY